MIHNWYRRREREETPVLKVISSVSGPIIPLETLRLQCGVITIDVDSDGVESSPDDPLLLIAHAAAVEHAEEFTGLSIVQRTYEMALDRFPRHGIEILKPPIIEILSFQFAEGSDGEVEPESYVLDDYRFPPVLSPIMSWPSVIHATNVIKFRYRAGYSNEVNADSDAPLLPPSVKQALLLLTAHFYLNREATLDRVLATIPYGFEDLLRAKKVDLGIA